MKRANAIGPRASISLRRISSTGFINLQLVRNFDTRSSYFDRDCMAKIDAFFNLMFEQKASDLHLASGNPPILRINGELHRVDYPPLESDALKAMLYEIAPEYKIKIYEETGDVDFGYEIPGV